MKSDKEEIKILEKKLKILREKELNNMKKIKLKREIWKHEHKGIYNTANMIEKTGTGIFNAMKKGAKKLSESDEKIKAKRRAGKKFDVENLIP